MISFVMPSIRPALWEKTYNMVNITNVSFELIILTPTDTVIPEWCEEIENIRIIKTNVKPVQCWHIGILEAKGKFFTLMPDDLTSITEYAYDEAVKIYDEKNNWKTLVSINMTDNDVSMTEYNYYPNYQTPDESILLPSGFTIINLDYLKKMGGFDRNFMQAGEQDLWLRCLADGATSYYCETASLNEHRKAQGEDYGGNKANRVASDVHDKGMLHKLWRDNTDNKGLKWKTNIKDAKRANPLELFYVGDVTYTATQGATTGRWQ